MCLTIIALWSLHPTPVSLPLLPIRPIQRPYSLLNCKQNAYFRHVHKNISFRCVRCLCVSTLTPTQKKNEAKWTRFVFAYCKQCYRLPLPRSQFFLLKYVNFFRIDWITFHPEEKIIKKKFETGRENTDAKAHNNRAQTKCIRFFLWFCCVPPETSLWWKKDPFEWMHESRWLNHIHKFCYEWWLWCFVSIFLCCYCCHACLQCPTTTTMKSKCFNIIRTLFK